MAKRKSHEVVFESKLDRNIRATRWTNNPKTRKKQILQVIADSQVSGDWGKFSDFECFANTNVNDIEVYVVKKRITDLDEKLALIEQVLDELKEELVEEIA